MAILGIAINNENRDVLFLNVSLADRHLANATIDTPGSCAKRFSEIYCSKD
jgi:hypothetical protein